MNRTSFRRVAAPTVAALALGMSLTACGAGNEESSSDASNASGDSLSGTLNGAGASSQEAAQGAWQAAFQSANSGVTVNYDPVGSGGGREQFLAGGVVVRRLGLLPGRRGARRVEGDLRRRRGVRGARLRQPDRPGLQPRGRRRPAAVRPRRSPASSPARSPSGTTRRSRPTTPTPSCPPRRSPPCTARTTRAPQDNFTAVPLRRRSRGAGPSEPDGVWPLKSGEGANGTSGVIESVTNGAGSIGYADESQAGDLGIARIKVGEDYVAPTAETAAEGRRRLPAGRGPPRRRHRHRRRPHHHRGRRLPDRAGVLRHRLPDLRRRGEGRAGQGLPVLRGRAPTASRQPPRPPAPRRCRHAQRRGRSPVETDQVHRLTRQHDTDIGVRVPAPLVTRTPVSSAADSTRPQERERT